MLERMYGVAIKENSDIVICDMIDYYEDGTRKFLKNLTIWTYSDNFVLLIKVIKMEN